MDPTYSNADLIVTNCQMWALKIIVAQGDAVFATENMVPLMFILSGGRLKNSNKLKKNSPL